MHPHPKKFLFRISIGLACIIGFGYQGYNLLQTPLPDTRSPAVLRENIPDVPDLKGSLKSAKTIHSLLKTPTSEADGKALDTQLFPKKPNATSAYAQIRPTLIMTSNQKNFAVIDNKIYMQGERLPDGRKIAWITQQGIYLSTKGKKQFILWTDPKEVVLVKGSPSDGESRDNSQPQGEESAPAKEKPLQKGSQQGIDAEKLDKLLKKIE